MSDDFLGAGWSFPPRIDQAGSVVLSHGIEKIEQSIRLILGTLPGERPMRPEFGCDLHRYVFGPADARTRTAIAREVRAALRRWEPRIELRTVEVLPDRDEPEVLYIALTYAVSGTNSTRNLVFPFYRIPAEPQEARP